MYLHLLRHATSVRSQVGIWGRTYDAPLSSAHLGQLDATRDILALLDAPTIFSSPLLRCIQSLDYSLKSKWPVNVIPEFRAYHSGSLENLTEAYIATHYPNYLTLSYSARFTSPLFDEESLAEQTKRVKIGIRKMLPLVASPDAVICSHFSVINIIANIVVNNFDLTTYGEGRFAVPEGGLLTLHAYDSQLREALRDS